MDEQEQPMLPVSPERIEAIEERLAAAEVAISQLREQLQATQLLLAMADLSKERDRLGNELAHDVLRGCLSEQSVHSCRELLANIHGICTGQLESAANPLQVSRDGVKEMQEELVRRLGRGVY